MSYTLSATAERYQPEWVWNTDPAVNSAQNQADAYLEAARLGDDFAFGNLIEFYRATAERAAHQILHTEDAAADAVQEALIKAHRAMNRFQDGNFRSWFLRIVTMSFSGTEHLHFRYRDFGGVTLNACLVRPLAGF